MKPKKAINTTWTLLLIQAFLPMLAAASNHKCDLENANAMNTHTSLLGVWTCPQQSIKIGFSMSNGAAPRELFFTFGITKIPPEINLFRFIFDTSAISGKYSILFWDSELVHALNKALEDFCLFPFYITTLHFTHQVKFSCIICYNLSEFIFSFKGSNAHDDDEDITLHDHLSNITALHQVSSLPNNDDCNNSSGLTVCPILLHWHNGSSEHNALVYVLSSIVSVFLNWNVNCNFAIFTKW